MDNPSEFDAPAATLRGAPKTLEALINLGMGEERLWRNEDLAAIFRHQLSASLVLDLGGSDPGEEERVKRVCASREVPLKTFGDLFGDPKPPRELLIRAKNFAKDNMVRPGCAVPGEIATALYYVSIAAALVRRGLRISKLGDADLRRSLIWIKGQPWIDAGTVRLLGDALASIGSPERGGA